VDWRWRTNGTTLPHLLIEWREFGGPSVPTRSPSGYGTSIIRELLPYELGGKVELAFANDGVSCKLEIPAEWIGSGQLCGHLMLASTS